MRVAGSLDGRRAWAMARRGRPGLLAITGQAVDEDDARRGMRAYDMARIWPLQNAVAVYQVHCPKSGPTWSGPALHNVNCHETIANPS